MRWIKYTDNARSNVCRATITASGYLLFSQGAVKRFHLASFTHIVLYLSEDARYMAVEPTSNPEAEGARRLRFRGGSADLSIRPFLDSNGIRPSTTVRFDPEIDPDTGWIVINLAAGKPRGASEEERGSRGDLQQGIEEAGGGAWH